MGTKDPQPGEFVFVACQPAATRLCRAEIAAIRPEWTATFSRPGLSTYRVNSPIATRFELPITFARTCGFSMAQVRGDDSSNLVEAIQNRIAAGFAMDRIHLWDRCWQSRKTVSGDREYAAQELSDVFGRLVKLFPEQMRKDQSTAPDQVVLDVARIDTRHWLLGWHCAGAISQRWPGGVPIFGTRDDLVSRAWYKTAESLMWSGIPLSRGDVCVEIGSAPGGSCQRLLESGAKVIAVDPAELDPRIAGNKNVVHIRKRGRDVPHRELAEGKWLLVDTNIAPSSAMQMTQKLVTGQHTGFRGVLLTLKMPDDDLATKIPDYIEQVRSWGFRYVKTRHLAYGRREICLAALKQKSVRRFRK